MKLWPFGFHTGPTGAGVPKTFWSSLSVAGISAMQQTTDDYGKLYDALEAWRITGTPHLLVWRTTDHDVPDYFAHPLDAAVKMLADIMLKLPPEFDRERVWLGVDNEVDKNRSEWLADFHYYFGDIAWNEEGLKTVHFNWSSGEPEPEHWRGTKMQTFLKHAGENPGYLMIGLHEYSLDKYDIQAGAPYHVGRFQDMLDSCVSFKAPNFCVTEFGWTLWDLPAQDFETQLTWAASQYAEIPEFQGAAIWCLNGGWKTIHEQLLGYVPLIRAMALDWPYGETPYQPPSTPSGLGKVVYLLVPPYQTISDLQVDLAVQFATWGFYPDGETEKTDGEHPISPSHLDAFQSVMAGDKSSRLFILWSDDIGTGITREWLDAEFPEVSARTTLVSDPAESMLIEPVMPEFPFGELFLAYPLSEQGYRTSKFGDPRDYDQDGNYDDLHEGIDLSTYDQTATVLASYSGEVTSVRITKGYGKRVVILSELDGFKFSVWYAHLGGFNVEEGDWVNVGEAVGPMGNSGFSSGPHLHLTLQVPGYGADGYVLSNVVNPEPFIVPFKSALAKPPLFGLHATADPGTHPEDPDIVATSQIEAIKVLSNIDPADLTELVGRMNNKRLVVIRPYLSMEGRSISPQQFFDDTISDTRRTWDRLHQFQERVIELHNEPNLSLEGLGTSWNNGTEFGYWLESVLELYRAAFDARMLYPGLSPGHAFDNGSVSRQDMFEFLNRSRMALSKCDGLGVHTYWSTSFPMSWATDLVRQVTSLYPNKPLFITEASNNKADVNKGEQYVAFWRNLAQFPQVTSVFYFVSSASHQDFQNEVWTGTNIAEIVGQR